MNNWHLVYKSGGYHGCGSGTGSILENNLELIGWLNDFIKKHSIKSLLDMGCGDMQWMPYVNLTNVHYVGIDYVDYLIEHNRTSFPQLTFSCQNILDSDFSIGGKFDLVFCKDVLHHCNESEYHILMDNIKKIDATFKLIIGPKNNFPFTRDGYIWEYMSDVSKRVFMI